MSDTDPHPEHPIAEPVEPPTALTPDADTNPDMRPVREEPPPPPPKERVDNTEAEAAVNFLKAGVPLQDGTPSEPVAVLNRLLREQKQ